MMRRNTWFARGRRTLGAFFSVASNRQGHCRHCGACCKLPTVCRFLKHADDGRQYCSIYRLRPLNCRKYPRTEGEFITEDTCGFYFSSLSPQAARTTPDS